MADNATTGTSMGGGTGAAWAPDNGGLAAVGKQAGASAGAAAGTATSIAQAAQEYAGKVSDVAVHAKDYVTDKASLVSDKIKEFSHKDIGEVAENAKEYARQNPGQAILISAGIGLLLGLLVRGRR